MIYGHLFAMDIGDKISLGSLSHTVFENMCIMSVCLTEL